MKGMSAFCGLLSPQTLQAFDPVEDVIDEEVGEEEINAQNQYIEEITVHDIMSIGNELISGNFSQLIFM